MYKAINPIRVSSNANSLYNTRNGNAKTTGGRISCDKKKNEISVFRINPNRYLNRLNPYAVQLPSITAMLDEQTAIMVEFQNRFKNSSLTVLSIKIVLGDNPKDLKPNHFGLKSHHIK